MLLIRPVTHTMMPAFSPLFFSFNSLSEKMFSITLKGIQQCIPELQQAFLFKKKKKKEFAAIKILK